VLSKFDPDSGWLFSSFNPSVVDWEHSMRALRWQFAGAIAAAKLYTIPSNIVVGARVSIFFPIHC
jgi:hypothetical protein